jgi:UDP-3-O-[3-hydroxymyristoyl] glucosamine N-acyltransferase
MASLKSLLELPDSIIEFNGNEEHIIKHMLQLTDTSFDQYSLAWCSDKNKEFLIKINTGSIILSENSFSFAKDNNSAWEKVNWIVVEQPRHFFSLVLNSFFVKKPILGRVEKSAAIHESAIIDSSCYIGHNVVIEEDVVIGKNCRINHNTAILSGTIIYENVIIGCNCTIGGVGFGYELTHEGSYDVIPHIGNVEIKSNVEIGNNVCIDRAVLGSTFIRENVKIDNLVHIAHGVQIGENSLIIANAMIAGSVNIGKNVWVAPSSSIIQKIDIKDNSLVGMGSVVIKEVAESTIVAGNPAKKIKSK